MPANRNRDEIFIVDQMLRGDKQAFKYFFDKYYDELCNFVNIYLHNNDLAEEVVQDIFVYLWENKTKIKIQTSLKSYLYSASKYQSLNRLRNQKRKISLQEMISDESLNSLGIETDSFSNTEDLKKILEDAFLQLPEKCRQIFILSKQNELTNKEIAERLGISIKTVENQMTIALKKLRAYLTPYREKIFLFFLLTFFI